MRRFRCSEPKCPKKTFAEQLSLFAPYAQRSKRLNTSLKTLATKFSAELTARLLPKLHLGHISADTLLRLAKQALPPVSINPTPKVIGVDDFAFRKGQRYGTIIVDLEEHRPIDLLADRSAKSLIEWLKLHPELEIVSRNRSTEYTRAILEGAPQAVQIADRWHVIKNWKEVLERIFHRHYAGLTQRLKDSGRLISTIHYPRTSSTERLARKAAQLRRKARYEKIKDLDKQGRNILQIAEQLQMSRITVRKYLTMDISPEPIKKQVKNIINPYIPHLEKHWLEGCHNAKQLWHWVKQNFINDQFGPKAALTQFPFILVLKTTNNVHSCP